MKVKPIREPLNAWRYISPNHVVPAWVDRCTEIISGQLVLMRQSGREVINEGDYLVRKLDGHVAIYTPEEFSITFEVVHG